MSLSVVRVVNFNDIFFQRAYPEARKYKDLVAHLAPWLRSSYNRVIEKLVQLLHLQALKLIQKLAQRGKRSKGITKSIARLFFGILKHRLFDLAPWLH